MWVTGGCTSYYIDRNGHNSALWPTYTWPFRRRLRRFDAAAYCSWGYAPRTFRMLGGPSSSRVRTVPGQ